MRRYKAATMAATRNVIRTRQPATVEMIKPHQTITKRNITSKTRNNNTYQLISYILYI